MIGDEMVGGRECENVFKMRKDVAKSKEAIMDKFQRYNDKHCIKRVPLTEKSVKMLDDYKRKHGLKNRSSALEHALISIDKGLEK